MSSVKYIFAKTCVRMVDKIRRMYEKTSIHYWKKEFKHLGANPHIEYPASIMNPQCISIGDNFTGRSGFKLRAYTSFAGIPHDPAIIIGNNVHLAVDCTINATHRIEIRDNAALGVGSKVMDHMHGQADFSDLHIPILERELTSKGSVIIGENAMLGTGVVILPGVEIGANSVIGSNAVVTRSIPPNSIAAGIPARVLKTIQPPV